MADVSINIVVNVLFGLVQQYCYKKSFFILWLNHIFVLLCSLFSKYIYRSCLIILGVSISDPSSPQMLNSIDNEIRGSGHTRSPNAAGAVLLSCLEGFLRPRRKTGSDQLLCLEGILRPGGAACIRTPPGETRAQVQPPPLKTSVLSPWVQRWDLCAVMKGF